jgi:hypothetical protein
MTHPCKHCGTELKDERIDGLPNNAHPSLHLFVEVQEYTYWSHGKLVHDKSNAVHGKGRCRNILRKRDQALVEAFLRYIERWGLEHEHNCPEDDTCDCLINMAINIALKEHGPFTKCDTCSRMTIANLQRCLGCLNEEGPVT